MIEEEDEEDIWIAGVVMQDVSDRAHANGSAGVLHWCPFPESNQAACQAILRRPAVSARPATDWDTSKPQWCKKCYMKCRNNIIAERQREAEMATMGTDNGEDSCRDSIHRSVLAMALGVDPSKMTSAEMVHAVLANRNELARLRVTVEHQRQEILLARSRQ